MGKVRTRVLGLENVESEQKKKQKQKAVSKKDKLAIHLPGQKGGERTSIVTADEAAAAKQQKAEAEIKAGSPAQEKKTKAEKLKRKKTKERTRGKKYLLALRLRSGQAKTAVALVEAIALLKKMKFAKFDESVELHLNVEKAGMRGEVPFPHETGKKLRVAVVDEKVLANLQKGTIDFDVLVAHPSFMPALAPFAKILGPRGLMPNPKTGTISDKPEEVAKRLLSGLTKWKGEPKFPLVHIMIAKASAGDKAIAENAAAFITAVGKNSVKSAYIKTTMSPSIELQIDT